MNLETLRIFLVVAEVKSIARAAEILDMNGSSISRKIKGLEEELNTELFHRGGKEFNTTSQGTQILKQVGTVLGEVDQIRNLANNDQEVSGPISLIVPPTIGNALAERFLVPFIKRYPKVKLRIKVNSGRQVDTLYDNDLAISPNLPSDSSLIAKKIFNGKQHFYAGTGLLEKYGVPSHPAELENYPYLVLLDDKSYSQDVQTWNNGQGLSGKFNTNSVAYSDHTEILARMVADNVGVACLPKGAFLNNPTLNFVRLFADEYYNQNCLYAIYPSRQYRPHRINVLAEELERFFNTKHAL
ncbi:LysR family transcriptional regulator [Ferrimonas lipolytica]|uniref:LysR family transcriptional regulator n=1 Tax=Ferrimonas lipolytica TaxID=2724191 RepID=A0A6H1UDD6_9GAMM|nr:LysR family transcriptional regulator [Ferrimonas lipolytica]QIZ76639.1 LysR family transcriptional regulator [Ferrimonas lipolytica]